MPNRAPSPTGSKNATCRKPEAVSISNGRRAWLAAGALLLLGSAARQVSGQDPPRTLRIVARKFEYEPREIRLKKGEPVALEFASLDVAMGFNSVDFNVRADIVPGKVTRLVFTPDKAGTFVFFCDVFCGNGHEEMAGALIVTE